MFLNNMQKCTTIFKKKGAILQEMSIIILMLNSSQKPTCYKTSPIIKWKPEQNIALTRNLLFMK